MSTVQRWRTVGTGMAGHYHYQSVGVGWVGGLRICNDLIQQQRELMSEHNHVPWSMDTLMSFLQIHGVLDHHRQIFYHNCLHENIHPWY